MSTTTPNLGLFKYNPETDGKETFSITTALNNNWDILDNAMSSTSSLGESGYMKFNNGLLINYGQASISSQEVTWQQPVLSSNGTMGRDTFACATSGVYGACYAWKAFDNSSSTDWISSAQANSWISFYSSTPIAVSQLVVSEEYYASSIKIQACNDNQNWVQVGSWTRNITIGSNAKGISTIPVDTEGNHYNYYRLLYDGQSTNGSNSYFFAAYSITITATYTTWSIDTITFPQAFTTTNYAYSLAYLNGVFGGSYASALTTTGMTLQNNSNADAVYYIAVGY